MRCAGAMMTCLLVRKSECTQRRAGDLVVLGRGASADGEGADELTVLEDRSAAGQQAGATGDEGGDLARQL
ncbi:hypothetical protein OG578_04160 [Streptomyces canus]|nr:hypothetical protein [Streptomyces canus]